MGLGGSYYRGSGASEAAAYRLVDTYTASAFFDKFTFYDRYDPTNGHVKYVNNSVALINGYAYYSSVNNSAVIKPDTIYKWPPGMFPNGEYLAGRPSVRLESFNTSCHGLSGCGSELKNTTTNPNNYGASFNANRGGVYAIEWTSNYIKHWWFPRGQVPASITAGNPDVSTFGNPMWPWFWWDHYSPGSDRNHDRAGLLQKRYPSRRSKENRCTKLCILCSHVR